MYINTKLLGMVPTEQMKAITSFLDIPTKNTLVSLNWGDNGKGEVIVVKYRSKLNGKLESFWDFNYFAPEEITADEVKVMIGFLEYHGVTRSEAEDHINPIYAQFRPKSTNREKVVKSKAKTASVR